MSWIDRWIVVICMVGTSGVSFAQGGFSVRGSVVDPTGAVISGATVQVANLSGMVLREAQTDGQGDFVLEKLGGGNLSLVVPAYAGFAEQTVALPLHGNIMGLKVTMSGEA